MPTRNYQPKTDRKWGEQWKELRAWIQNTSGPFTSYDYKGRYTRQQVQRALGGMARIGEIKCVKPSGDGRNATPAVYEARQ